jgi:hypothetical protein
MTYKTDEGELIEGNSPIEIVRALRNGGRFCAEQADDEYMSGFAARWKEYSENIVRFDTAENFVDDLVKTGFLKPV